MFAPLLCHTLPLRYAMPAMLRFTFDAATLRFMPFIFSAL